MQLFILFTATILLSCTNKKSIVDGIDVSTLKEGDTIPVNDIPNNLILWMNYHSNYQSKIVLSDFKCSGVLLHQNELPMLDSFYSNYTIIPKNKYLVFSPKKTKFIDLFAVTRKNERNNDSIILPFALDIDQQIILGYSDGRRYELFFCGPNQLIETADWLNEYQVILTVTSMQENQHNVDLYLFDLEKGIFTNFMLSKDLHKNVANQTTFIDHWIKIIENKK